MASKKQTEKEKQKSCFVVGPIGALGTEVRRGADWLLRGIIRPVLSAEPFNYDVKRADEYADPVNITDQVINAISDADLVVADLTGHNPNAFYELAFRHTEQKPVVHMIRDGEEIPFDIKDYRAVKYRLEDFEDHQKARRDLAAQVKAVEAPGYTVSNPIIKARGFKELAQSSEPKDKLIADMQVAVQRLGSRVSELETTRALKRGSYVKQLWPSLGSPTSDTDLAARVQEMRNRELVRMEEDHRSASILLKLADDVMRQEDEGARRTELSSFKDSLAHVSRSQPGAFHLFRDWFMGKYPLVGMAPEELDAEPAHTISEIQSALRSTTDDR
jgi:hypothetical protein